MNLFEIVFDRPLTFFIGYLCVTMVAFSIKMTRNEQGRHCPRWLFPLYIMGLPGICLWMSLHLYMTRYYTENIHTIKFLIHHGIPAGVALLGGIGIWCCGMEIKYLGFEKSHYVVLVLASAFQIGVMWMGLNKLNARLRHYELCTIEKPPLVPEYLIVYRNSA